MAEHRGLSSFSTRPVSSKPTVIDILYDIEMLSGKMLKFFDSLSLCCTVAIHVYSCFYLIFKNSDNVVNRLLKSLFGASSWPSAAFGLLLFVNSPQSYASIRPYVLCLLGLVFSLLVPVQAKFIQQHANSLQDISTITVIYHSCFWPLPNRAHSLLRMLLMNGALLYYDWTRGDLNQARITKRIIWGLIVPWIAELFCLKFVFRYYKARKDPAPRASPLSRPGHSRLVPAPARAQPTKDKDTYVSRVQLLDLSEMSCKVDTDLTAPQVSALLRGDRAEASQALTQWLGKAGHRVLVHEYQVFTGCVLIVPSCLVADDAAPDLAPHLTAEDTYAALPADLRARCTLRPGSKLSPAHQALSDLNAALVCEPAALASAPSRYGSHSRALRVKLCAAVPSSLAALGIDPQSLRPVIWSRVERAELVPASCTVVPAADEGQDGAGASASAQKVLVEFEVVVTLSAGLVGPIDSLTVSLATVGDAGKEKEGGHLALRLLPVAPVMVSVMPEAAAREAALVPECATDLAALIGAWQDGLMHPTAGSGTSGFWESIALSLEQHAEQKGLLSLAALVRKMDGGAAAAAPEAARSDIAPLTLRFGSPALEAAFLDDYRGALRGRHRAVAAAGFLMLVASLTSNVPLNPFPRLRALPVHGLWALLLLSPTILTTERYFYLISAIQLIIVLVQQLPNAAPRLCLTDAHRWAASLAPGLVLSLQALCLQTPFFCGGVTWAIVAASETALAWSRHSDCKAGLWGAAPEAVLLLLPTAALTASVAWCYSRERAQRAAFARRTATGAAPGIQSAGSHRDLVCLEASASLMKASGRGRSGFGSSEEGPLLALGLGAAAVPRSPDAPLLSKVAGEDAGLKKTE